MSAMYLNLHRMYSATSFIDVDYSFVLDPPDRFNMKPFRSSHFSSNFIVWVYVAVPGCSIHDVLVVGENIIYAPFSTLKLS